MENPDTDNDGKPNGSAEGDDINGNDDEDGVEVEDHEVTIIDGDTDDDGMTDAYENMYPDELDPNDPNDADDQDDSDGLNNLAEFMLGTDPGEPDTDFDGIGDPLDNEPITPSNPCDNGVDATLENQMVMSGEILQCGAQGSVTVESTTVINSGGRVQIISPTVIFSNGFSVPEGGELEVDSDDPIPVFF